MRAVLLRAVLFGVPDQQQCSFLSLSHRLVTSAAACLSSFQHGRNLFFCTASITTRNAATAFPFLSVLPAPLSLVSTTVGAGRARAASSAVLVIFLRNGWGRESLLSSTIGDWEVFG